MLTQAVILCGGLGTRLGKLTAVTPKPLLPVAGQPFLDILLQEVARFGFTDILLLAGRFGNQIYTRYQGRMMFGARISVLIEPTPRGTAGALRFAYEHLASEFLAVNGDSWIDADLRRFAWQWEQASVQVPGAMVQMLLHPVPNSARYGIVTTEGPIVTAFREKDTNSPPASGLINAGVYILRRELVGALAEDTAISIETDILPALATSGKVLSTRAPEGSYFVDIGVPESYDRAQTAVPTVRRRRAVFFDRDGTLNLDPGYTHEPDCLCWTSAAREAIAHANRIGAYVFVVTNQAGVAKGHFPEAAVLQFHSAMQADLFRLGAHIDAIEWCPHHTEATVEHYRRDCRRRKPSGGMLMDIMAAWPVDVGSSIMVGDAESDLAAAAAAGVRGILYRGGSLLDTLRDALG